MSRYSDAVLGDEPIAYWKMNESPIWFDFNWQGGFEEGSPGPFTFHNGSTWAYEDNGYPARGAHPTAGTGMKLMTLDGTADGIMHAQLTEDTVYDLGDAIVFRFIDINNYLAVTFDGRGTRIVKVDGGVETQLAILATPLPGGSWFVKFVGNQIGATHAGIYPFNQNAVSYTLTSAEMTKYGAATKHGLRTTELDKYWVFFGFTELPVLAVDHAGDFDAPYLDMYGSVGNFGIRKTIIGELPIGDGQVLLPTDSAFRQQNFTIELWASGDWGNWGNEFGYLYEYTNRNNNTYPSRATKGVEIYNQIVGGAGKVRARIYAADGSFREAVATGGVSYPGRHIVLTVDQTNVKLYRDGLLEATVARNGLVIDYPTTGTIRHDTGGYSIEVSHVAVYDRALDAAEVAEHFGAARSSRPMPAYDPQFWANGPLGGTPLEAERLMTMERGIEAATRQHYAGTIVVAASDAPAAWKSVADYVCDGANDGAMIASALGDADVLGPGTTVQLSPGRFTPGIPASGRVVDTEDFMDFTNMTIRGAGHSATWIEMPDGASTIFYLSSSDGVEVSDIGFTGPGQHTAVYCGGNHFAIHDLRFHETEEWVGVYLAGGYGGGVESLIGDGIRKMVVADGSWNSTFGDIYAYSYMPDSVGLHMIDGLFCTVTNVNLEAFDIGILLYDCKANTIEGNAAYWHGEGIVIDNSFGNKIGGNVVTGWYDDTAPSPGIRLANGAGRNVVSGNIIQWAATHGILLDGASDNDISGNGVFGNSELNGATPIYDGIALQNGASRNHVHDNIVRRKALEGSWWSNDPTYSKAEHRYAISVLTADCVGNKIHANDLEDGGASGPLLDLGTNTKTLLETGATPVGNWM